MMQNWQHVQTLVGRLLRTSTRPTLSLLLPSMLRSRYARSFSMTLLPLGRPVLGLTENKHSADVESTNRARASSVSKRILHEGKKCSDLGRVLALNDPPACSASATSCPGRRTAPTSCGCTSRTSTASPPACARPWYSPRSQARRSTVVPGG